MSVVGVANGPVTVHSEYLLLADIHIASERATYGDFAHAEFGITGGDGVQVVWEEVAGTAHAKWLLWTGETIDAQTALDWGVVSEVVPRPGPRPRHPDRPPPGRQTRPLPHPPEAAPEL